MTVIAGSFVLVPYAKVGSSPMELAALVTAGGTCNASGVFLSSCIKIAH